MKRSLIVAAAAALLAVPTYALGPVTNATTAANSAATVTVTVPGLVGVDVESNVAFDFTTMTPATPTWTCAQSANHWPISINCSANGSGNVVYLPTNDTSAGTVSPAPVNATTTYTTLTDTSDKGIWVALFCSKSAGAQPTLTAALSSTWSNGAPVGYDQTNFYIRRSSNVGGTNPSNVGYATDQQFLTGGAPIATAGMMGSTLGAAGATFGWTRADQVISMKLANNANIGDPGAGTAHAVNLTVTISKP
jgi:hypothetical protein